MKITGFVYGIVTTVSIGLASVSFADIDKNLSHFGGSYGKPVGDKPTSTGRIVAWKMGEQGVVMAEFGPEGRARNVVYRLKGSVGDSDIANYLSKNTTSSGSFHRVDVPKLNELLARLPTVANDPNVPEQVKMFAKAINPQSLSSLSQTINSVGDLRATRDGKYIAMIDSRGQILVLRIDGPSLPLIN